MAANNAHASRWKAAKLVVAAALLVYPLAIYFMQNALKPSELLAGLLLLFAARTLLAAWIGNLRRMLSALIAAVLFAAAVTVVLWLPGLKINWLRYYPMLLDLAAFAVFFGSLFTRMPLVERFARLVRDDLPPQGVRYTRQVTWAWSGLLLAVAAGSLYTAVAAPLRIWSLYNGLIVYLIFGAAFGCEYIVRTYLRHRWAAA